MTTTQIRKNKLRANFLRWSRGNPQRYRELKKLALWKQQGICLTIDQYKEMIKCQNNSCAICKRHRNEFKNNLSVDHNHKTRQVRGLLCYRCNLVVGVVENHRLLRKVYKYLKTPTPGRHPRIKINYGK